VPAPPSFIARTTPRASPLSRPRGGIYLAPLGSRQRAPTAVAFPASALVCGIALSGCEAGPTPAPLGATTSLSQLAEHLSRLRLLALVRWRCGPPLGVRALSRLGFSRPLPLAASPPPTTVQWAQPPAATTRHTSQ
jgi:hypothetical protein